MPTNQEVSLPTSDRPTDPLLQVAVQDPGVADESLIDPRVERARAALDAVIEKHGLSSSREHIPPWCGDDTSLVVSIFAAALGGAIGNEVLSPLIRGGFVKPVQEFVEALREFLESSRKSRVVPCAFADESGLKLLAVHAACAKSPGLETDFEMIQVMSDGSRHFEEASEIGGVKLAFPQGVFVVRVPDVARRTTHLVTIRSDGFIIAHAMHPYLPREALMRDGEIVADTSAEEALASQVMRPVRPVRQRVAARRGQIGEAPPKNVRAKPASSHRKHESSPKKQKRAPKNPTPRTTPPAKKASK